ncbi:phage/conjugal plasmid C-4 type zinc finger protein, TraR family [compost metagenome]
MADFADMGSERSEQLLAEALARHQRAAQAAPATSALWCEDCGEAIPLLRREKVLGCQTCIDCQHVRETRRD